MNHDVTPSRSDFHVLPNGAARLGIDQALDDLVYYHYKDAILDLA